MDTEDAKNIILQKKLVDKVGLAFVKQNHEHTVARFFSLLPEQSAMLFDPRVSRHLRIDSLPTGKKNCTQSFKLSEPL